MWVTVAKLSTVLASSTPEMVIDCGTFQFCAVNVSVDGAAVTVVVAELATATLTLPFTGCVSRTSVYCREPFSCTTYETPPVDSVAPRVSLSVTVNVTATSSRSW